MRDCLACHRHIIIGYLLECSKCQRKFHYACVGIQSTCPACSMLTQRRLKNDDTPVRSQKLSIDDTNMSIDERLYEGHSTLADTLNTNVCCSPGSPHLSSKQNSRGEVTPTLEQIGNLLDEKLRTNTKYLSEMATLQSIIKTDILSALEEFKWTKTFIFYNYHWITHSLT